MEPLGQTASDVIEILNFHISGIDNGTSVEDKLADIDSAIVYYQLAGVCGLLLDADIDFYFENLVKGGLLRRDLMAKNLVPDENNGKLLKISKTAGLYGALAARQKDLARQIAKASHNQWLPAFEYEDDYLIPWFLHSYLTGADKPELENILARYTSVSAGDNAPQFGLCEALLSKDEEAVKEAFQLLLDAYDDKLLQIKQESIVATEGMFVPLSAVYIEGLAWLFLFEDVGINLSDDYKYCPKLARSRSFNLPDSLAIPKI